MVKQTRQIFELTDIKAVRFKCNGCEGEFVQELKKGLIPEMCPNPICDQIWEKPNDTTDNYWLIRAAKSILSPAKDRPPPMTIRFEIDGEDTKD